MLVPIFPKIFAFPNGLGEAMLKGFYTFVVVVAWAEGRNHA
jgi:hypothetical protein